MTTKDEGSKAPSAKPQVWWSSLAWSGGQKSEIEPYLAAPYTGMNMVQSLGELNQTLRMMVAPIPEDRRPTGLCWRLRKITDKERAIADATMIHMAALLVSEAFRSVVAEFDLGESQFIEAPLYEANSKDIVPGVFEIDPDRRDPRRWFLFHILPRKSALLPEASTGLYMYSEDPEWWGPLVGGTNGIHDMVLDAGKALSGPDIWRDPTIPRLVFFSDRLKRAIKAAKLRTPAFAFKPCRTV